MMDDRMEQHPGARFLFVAAMTVVVVYGLKVAAPILIPFSLALFVAILSQPIMAWLRRRRIPALLAIVLTVLVTVALFGLLILIAVQSVSEFQERLPGYVTRFQVLTTSAIEWASAQGLPVGNEIISDLINPSGVVNFVGETFGRALGLLATTFLVFLITIFLLSEATVFPAKFRAILGRKQGDPRRLTKIVREVQEYLGIKTLISLATGLLLGLWTWMMGLDFPVLLGLVAFLLNYVPTIGSVLASFPAMLLALVQVGIGHSFVVMLGYAAVNLVFGNFLEPSLMGRRLGLSTLVVIFSLIFWAWVWGPVGALLAVPLTMVVRIMLENTPDLRWVVILLDKSPPQQVLAEDNVEASDAHA